MRLVRRLLVLSAAVVLAYVLILPSVPLVPHVIDPPMAARQTVMPGTIRDDLSSPIARTHIVEGTPSTVLGAMDIFPTQPHPSCIALQLVTKHVPWDAPPRSAPRGAPRPTPVPIPATLEYWREYSKPTFNCFKHGGHYEPGLPRRGGPHDRDHVEHLRRLSLRRVYYWNGEWYQPISNDAQPATVVLPYAAYFPMVSGNWPQPIVDRITVHRVHELPWATSTGTAIRMQHHAVAYLQPPTDFLSVYHVAVETLLPAFHMLHESGLAPGSVTVITSRPRASVYGFKDKSCALSHEECMNTVWGAMYLSLTIADETTARSLLAGRSKPSDVVMRCRRNSSRCVYGLVKGDQQLRHDIPNSKVYPFRNDEDRRTVLSIDQLFVGNPTHCEPLWGGDPHYAELVAQKHNIRGRAAVVGRGADGNHTLPLLGGLSVADLDAFASSYSSCQSVLRSFRRFFVRLVSPPSSLALTPIQAGSSFPVHIVVTSRKGDWARQLLDEDELVELLSQHVHAHYPRESTVRAIKFGGALVEQLHTQLDIEHTTIFVGNHGANLLNSVFLRPNAGLITLSLRNPGFYPFAVFPEWLHVRDIVAEQMCNRRLFKGKCRWMEGNNNDMFLDAAQRRLLLSHLDDIVRAQGDAQRR